MFEKVKFAQIIKEILETYDNQRDFSKKSEINRTYLSQYMNMKLDEPPKPKMLEKLAKASNGITSYNELMKICGYIDDNYYYNLHSLNDEQKEIDFYYANKLKSLSLSKEEKEIYKDLLEIIDIPKLSNLDEAERDIELSSYFSNMNYLNDNSKSNIINRLKIIIEYNSKIMNNLKNIAQLNQERKQNSTNIDENNLLLNGNSHDNIFFNIPVLGKIAAGQPILAEEYIEGYLPVNPNIYGMTTPDDYFYLKVSGESMNLKIQNGDYALIHKQDYAENGDIIVAIINSDDEATLKKYKKLTDEMVMLEPMSTYPMEPLILNLKETKFQIIGKAIGQFGKF